MKVNPDLLNLFIRRFACRMYDVGFFDGGTVRKMRNSDEVNDEAIRWIKEHIKEYEENHCG